jgi:hypothetical protein
VWTRSWGGSRPSGGGGRRGIGGALGWAGCARSPRPCTTWGGCARWRQRHAHQGAQGGSARAALRGLCSDWEFTAVVCSTKSSRCASGLLADTAVQLLNGVFQQPARRGGRTGPHTGRTVLCPGSLITKSAGLMTPSLKICDRTDSTLGGKLRASPLLHNGRNRGSHTLSCQITILTCNKLTMPEPDKAPLQGRILSPIMVRVGHRREGEPPPPADTHTGRHRVPSMAPRTG